MHQAQCLYKVRSPCSWHVLPCRASLQLTMRLHLQAGLHAEATKLALSLENTKQQSLALQLAILYDQEDMQGQA